MSITINMSRTKRDARRIQKSLERLGRESRQRKVIARALGPATVPMNKDAKQRAPRDSGQYAKSIGRVTRQYRGSGSVIVVIGPRTGFAVTRADGSRHDPVKIGHLLEFGHGGPRPAPAKPHMRPAFDAHSESAQRIFRREFARQFDIEARRLAAKGERI
jgi:HK97 gp10 family phage protein